MTPPSFTPADLARSLVEHLRSLGVVSHEETALKRYADDLQNQLRAIDSNIGIEEYSGDGFLNLISRLNQEVAPYLLQQAMPSANTPSVRVWVIDKANLLTTEQQSIIFKLIELFPALPFRVIWLSTEPLQAWKEHAKTECIFLDPDGTPRAEFPPGSSESDPLGLEAPENRQHLHEEETHNGLQWPVTRSSWYFKAAVALAIAGILGALAWMSRSAPVEVTHKPGTTTPIAEAAATVSPPSADSRTAAASASAPTPSAPAQASSAPATEQSPKSTPMPPSESALKGPSKVGQKPLPEIAKSGGRWLKSLPPDTFVIEYGTWGTLEQSEKFKAKHKELSNARIIAMRKPATDDWQYMVVTGPFRSEERAKTYLSRQDKKTATRIRATDKLKSQIAS